MCVTGFPSLQLLGWDGSPFCGDVSASLWRLDALYRVREQHFVYILLNLKLQLSISHTTGTATGTETSLNVASLNVVKLTFTCTDFSNQKIYLNIGKRK